MQCQGTTQKQQQCKNLALAGSIYCVKHQDPNLKKGKQKSGKAKSTKSGSESQEGKEVKEIKEIKQVDKQKQKDEAKGKEKHSKQQLQDIAKGFTPYERLIRVAARSLRRRTVLWENLNNLCKLQTQPFAENKCEAMIEAMSDEFDEFLITNDRFPIGPYMDLLGQTPRDQLFRDSKPYWPPDLDRGAFYDRVLSDVTHRSKIEWMLDFSRGTADLLVLEDVEWQEATIRQIEADEQKFDAEFSHFQDELADRLEPYGVDVYVVSL